MKTINQSKIKHLEREIKATIEINKNTMYENNYIEYLKRLKHQAQLIQEDMS